MTKGKKFVFRLNSVDRSNYEHIIYPLFSGKYTLPSIKSRERSTPSRPACSLWGGVNLTDDVSNKMWSNYRILSHSLMIPSQLSVKILHSLFLPVFLSVSDSSALLPTHREVRKHERCFSHCRSHQPLWTNQTTPIIIISFLSSETWMFVRVWKKTLLLVRSWSKKWGSIRAPIDTQQSIHRRN